jgi:hypothetical protein
LITDEDETAHITGWVRLGYFREKTGSNRFGLVLLGFFWFGLDFFGLGSVQFFRFQTYKTGTKPVSFLKILIGLISFFTV